MAQLSLRGTKFTREHITNPTLRILPNHDKLMVELRRAAKEGFQLVHEADAFFALPKREQKDIMRGDHGDKVRNTRKRLSKVIAQLLPRSHHIPGLCDIRDIYAVLDLSEGRTGYAVTHRDIPIPAWEPIEDDNERVRITSATLHEYQNCIVGSWEEKRSVEAGEKPKEISVLGHAVRLHVQGVCDTVPDNMGWAYMPDSIPKSADNNIYKGILWRGHDVDEYMRKNGQGMVILEEIRGRKNTALAQTHGVHPISQFAQGDTSSEDRVLDMVIRRAERLQPGIFD